MILTEPGQDRRVMALLEHAAMLGEVCPSNLDIICAVRANSPATASRIIARLERSNLISVQRFNAFRIVTILATGRCTGGKAGASVHWSQRGIRPAQPKARPAPIVTTPSGATLPPCVHRDPCPRCGVRRDFGCAHHASELHV